MERFCVIPQPARYEVGKGEMIVEPRYACRDGRFPEAAGILSDALDRACGVMLKPGEGGIVFSFREDLRPDEYEISADENCLVACGGEEGAVYASATLAQLMKRTSRGFAIPRGVIRDAPAYPWRGLMVDLARQWHPIRFLFAYVDLCWLYKINRLQLHFSDDQAYSLPSRAFPALPSENRHYTAAELVQLGEYAKRRGVVIVPEIDFPGHSGEFNRKYPEIFGKSGILCCEEKTFSAIELLLKEVIALFPDSPYIHIGGDEAQYALWDDCPGCVEYRRSHGLPDARAQYAHYVDRLARTVLAMGKTPVAWEGFAREYNGMVTKELLVFSWENYYQPAPDLAEGGFTLINASWMPNYVCTPGKMWSRREILDWNPRKWTHWWPKSAAYNTTITVPESAPVLGGQLCAWGDELAAYPSAYRAAQEEFDNVRTRLPALAERTWRRGEDIPENGIWAEADTMARALTR